jgi:uncharacterized protein (DUF885 family)
MVAPLTSTLVTASRASLAAACSAPTIASIAIPGDARFVAIARDVLLVQIDYMPDFASQSGLIDDAIRTPSFAPEHIAALTRRLQAALAGLRQLPWRTWSVDAQIDVRWTFANAERINHELNVERRYLHRPGAWLEPLGNNYVAITTYAPEREDALARITQQVPALVREMESICKPTQADAEIACAIAQGIIDILSARPMRGSDAAIAALVGYRHRLDASSHTPAFSVVGAENYAWRLKHASLLPWNPAQLRALAEHELKLVDGQLAMLEPALAPPTALTQEQQALARNLDQVKLLKLYDDIQLQLRAAIEKSDFVTIPAGVGPIRARVTPDAMVPMSGDGGSMNSPPPFIDDSTGWWNVEHFKDSTPVEEREATVREALLFRECPMGPYAAHEGTPGHHLQLSIARLIDDPLRNLFQDPVQVEGWALYAEQAMWENGGLGASVAAHVHTLQSWRFRIRRVVYDVNVETGVWDLQQAADYCRCAAPGRAPIDAEIKRTINWPAQLICYFAGRQQILALKEDFKRQEGAAYSERRFNDELLALGSVPYVFARAKLLGEPVPDF